MREFPRLGVLSVLLAMSVIYSGCGDSTSSDHRSDSSGFAGQESTTTSPEQSVNTTGTTRPGTVPSTPVPFDPDAPGEGGPVSISITPGTVLAGGTIAVEYTTAPDGKSIEGRWEREDVAEWNSCSSRSCAQVGWLRIGAEPVLLPQHPYDRAYLPYDNFGQDRPGGPDDFEIPADTDGLHQVCSTLVSLEDASKTRACATVSVRNVQTEFTGRQTAWFEIDPAHPPKPTDIALNVLVHTSSCDRQAVVTDTQVTVSDSEIAISIGVESVDCSAAVPAGGPTAVRVDLPEPIGGRAILDVMCLGIFESQGRCTNERGRRWPVG